MTDAEMVLNAVSEARKQFTADAVRFARNTEMAWAVVMIDRFAEGLQLTLQLKIIEQMRENLPR